MFTQKFLKCKPTSFLSEFNTSPMLTVIDGALLLVECYWLCAFDVQYGHDATLKWLHILCVHQLTNTNEQGCSFAEKKDNEKTLCKTTWHGCHGHAIYDDNGNEIKV